MMGNSPGSRGRRRDGTQITGSDNGDNNNNGIDDDGYLSSSVASSYDYRALTEEEKKRILSQAAGGRGGFDIDLAAVKEQKVEAGNRDF